MRRAIVNRASVVGLAVLLLASCTSTGDGTAHISTIRRRGAEVGELDTLLSGLSDLLPSEKAGIAIGVIDGESTSLSFVGNPVIGPNTLFEFASITKVLTATVLVELAAEGFVSLDESVNRYLRPELQDPKWDGVTLARLATHTAGLPGLPPNLRPVGLWLRGQADDPFAAYDRRALEVGMRRARLDDGNIWEYSNFGYAVLGLILENVSGSSYADLVHSRVLARLGMEGATVSGWSSAEIAPPLRARGTPGSTWSFDAMAPAGALRGTIEDGLAFLRASMNACASGGSLSDALCRAQQPTGVRAAGLGEMGIGWMRSERHDVRIVWHNGGTGGYSTFLGFSPQKERGVVILSNVSGLRSIDGLARDFLASP